MTRLLPIALMITGLTSRYDLGVMQATLEARIDMGQFSQHYVHQFDGYAAVADCNRIGDTIWVLVNDGRHYVTGELVDGGRWQRVLIADCARRDGLDGALDWMTSNGILTEIDGPLAARYGFTHLGALPVVVSEAPPMISAN